MEPEYLNQTNLHPLALGVLAAAAFATVWVPRRWALLPTLATLCVLSPAQRVAVATIDFDVPRLLTLALLGRVLWRREWQGLTLLPLDWLLIASAAVVVPVASLIRGSSAIYVAGAAFNLLGLYYAARCLLRSWDDLDGLAAAAAVIAVPVAVAFAYEWRTRHNVFAVLGGVPEVTQMRGGRLRCQGAFTHPYLAGAFFASLVPLIWARLWLRKGGLPGPRPWATLVALAAAVAVVVFSASSTPLFGLAAGIVAVAAFGLRYQTGGVAWLAALGVAALAFVMEAPVWHLLARVSVVGGSTGYHRYALIDAAVENYEEWWLVGIAATDHWGRGLGDVTNHFVLAGVRGGLLAVILLVAAMATAVVGCAAAAARMPDRSPMQRYAWAMLAVFAAHAANFLGMSYFGQMSPLWAISLAAAAAVTILGRVPPRPVIAFAPEPVGGSN